MTADSKPGLARLFEEQHATLHRYFLKRTPHAQIPQDLTQTPYSRLLRVDRAGIGEAQNAETYLFTVAADLVKEHVVRRQRSPRGSDELEEVIERLASPCDGAAGVDRAIRRQRLADIIGRLTPKCRAVLVMHYRDGLDYRDMGDRLRISPHMVKKYIVKALATCRAGMARYD